MNDDEHDPEDPPPPEAATHHQPPDEPRDEATPAQVRPTWRRSVAWWVLGMVAIAAPLVGRVAWEGQAELRAAEAAARAGDQDLEIEHLGRAARWRLPGASHDEEALERLVDRGTEAELEGDAGTQRALAAYREARRAILATRAWGVPHPDTFAHVNERIARLMADQEERFETDVGGTGDPHAYHLALLSEVPGPSPWPANLAALAFIAWLVTTAGFVFRALDARGRLVPRPAVRWGIASLALLLVWIIALRFSGPG